MKLLLDQGLPRSASNLLSDRGINTIHVGDKELEFAAYHSCLNKSVK